MGCGISRCFPHITPRRPETLGPPTANCLPAPPAPPAAEGHSCHFFSLPELLNFHTIYAHHPRKMVLLSSKTIIQAHAVLLIVIAGYLIKNPALITNCDLVFMMGEALNIVRNTSLFFNQSNPLPQQTKLNPLLYPTYTNPTPGFPNDNPSPRKPLRLLLNPTRRNRHLRPNPPLNPPLQKRPRRSPPLRPPSPQWKSPRRRSPSPRQLAGIYHQVPDDVLECVGQCCGESVQSLWRYFVLYLSGEGFYGRFALWSVGGRRGVGED